MSPGTWIPSELACVFQQYLLGQIFIKKYVKIKSSEGQRKITLYKVDNTTSKSPLILQSETSYKLKLNPWFGNFVLHWDTNVVQPWIFNLGSEIKHG